MSLPASILSPTEGEQFVFPGLFIISTRVTAAQTSGAFELYELHIGQAAVDYHIHHRMDETLCVVEGEVEFTVEGQKYLRPAGSVAFIPRGVHHGFRNLSATPARVLIVFNPPIGQADYFRAASALLAAPTLDAAALQALQIRYDQELIFPNLVLE